MGFITGILETEGNREDGDGEHRLSGDRDRLRNFQIRNSIARFRFKTKPAFRFHCSKKKMVLRTHFFQLWVVAQNA